jgi:hypothetical protein
MTHRVNVLLDDTVWRVLGKAPKGERSRIVNAALRQWFQKRRRADAARRMDELRVQLPAVTTRQIVEWVREDRERAA